MTPESMMKLKKLLILQEGYSQFIYKDITGHDTIGYGRNLASKGISVDEANFLLENDINYFNEKLENNLDFFNRLDENRKLALIDMCFNIGFNNFMKFNKMIDFLSKSKYKEAHDEMISSKWASQVGDRAIKLANIILDGKI